MIGQFISRSALLRGCAPAALAGAALLCSQGAAAQAFQGTYTIAQGSVVFDSPVPTFDTITITGNDAVIDWTPSFGQMGELLTFLPNGNTATFQGTSNFAVLNRVLNSQTLEPVVFEGLVRSYLIDGQGNPTGQGGTVAFYSPTGILIGATAQFDVPRLVLTTHDVDLVSFANFASDTGALVLSGTDGPSIVIANGAAINASPKGSYFVVAAPSITMGGTATVNGSVVYVASNAVQLTHNSGLFDIIIPVGTQARNTITHTGTTTGPSSTGANDEQVIYAVARTASGSVSGGPAVMLISGNLGFAPAASASVVNGDIILSANYDVTGRTVDGGTNRQGINSLFDGRSSVNSPQLDMIVDRARASSNLLAIGTHQISVTGPSLFADDLVVVGRQRAEVNAATGDSISIAGDLLVSANNYVNRNAAGNPANVTGGFASLFTNPDSLIIVTGQTRVEADAIAGQNAATGAIGRATGGQAQIISGGGFIRLTGAAEISADAYTDAQGGFSSSGVMTGGLTELVALLGGSVELAGDAHLTASAVSPDLFPSNSQPGANAAAGSIVLGVGTGGGNLTVDGNTTADANAIAGSSAAFSGTGGTATGGSITLSAIDGGTMAFGGTATTAADVDLRANVRGGNIGGGTGGDAVGGIIGVSLLGSSAQFAGDLRINSVLTGGSGDIGGNAAAQPGTASVLLDSGTLTVSGALTLEALTTGGAGLATNGGDASGGDLAVQLLNSGVLDVSGETKLSILGLGGASLLGNGGAGTAGNAAIDVGALTQADFANVVLEASGTGGFTSAGTSGNGTGGGVSFAVSLGGDADIGGNLTAAARGAGGVVDASGNGSGGAGQGGAAGVDVSGSASQLHVHGATSLVAPGTGGLGGNGTGGDAAITVASTAQLFFDGITNIDANGQGGNRNRAGVAGGGSGGSALVDVFGTRTTFGNALSLAANGTGGNGNNSGAGTGGSADVELANARLDIARAFTMSATGVGGNTVTSGQAGRGIGGEVVLGMTQSSLLDAATSTILFDASGLGGDLTSGGGNGGDATGGSVMLNLLGEAIANLGTTFTIDASAEGGAIGGGNAGAATGGDIALTGSGGTFNFGAVSLDASALVVASLADGSPPAVAGTAAIGLTSSAMTGTALTVALGASAPDGLAAGGDFSLQAGDGSRASFASLNLSAQASSIAPDGEAAGGTALLETAGGTASQILIPTITLALSAQGNAQAVRTAGLFTIRAGSGLISSAAINATATGGQAGTGLSQIVANGGDIRIATQLNADLSGNLTMSYGNGNDIVGVAPPGVIPTGVFTVVSQGRITLAGDDRTTPGILARQLLLSSRDITVAPQTSALGDLVRLTSLDTANSATIGGTAQGPGYTLTQAEADGLRGDTLQIILPAMRNAAGALDPAALSAEVRALTLRGTTGESFSNISLESRGNLLVSGALNYTETAIDDALALSAAEELVVSLAGGAIRIVDRAGALSGSLTVTGGQIIAAAPTVASLILANPADPTIPGLLAADGGAGTAVPYMEAAGVKLAASDYILLQNTGANSVLAGITVGDGGLSIENASSPGAALRVIAYGARSAANGNVTNDDFFLETIDNDTLAGPFTADATLNDCVIDDGVCTSPVEIDLTNEVTITGPLAPDNSRIIAAAEVAFFGPDFPGLIDAPLISEDTMISDPVTSGSDSAANAAADEDDPSGDDAAKEAANVR